MTQVAFLKKADLPNKIEIEESIRQLGYEFEILDDFENFYGIDGIECTINGQKTFFEIYFNNPNEIISESEFIKKDLTDQDIAVSFIWGADFAAGASIGLISVALIDKCNALIYYLDDEIAYSKEMLLNDTPEFIKELEKQKKFEEQNRNSKPKIQPKKKGFWNGIKKLFK
ncbi:hypothetical protein SAMN05421824_3052 [Hyunsoonleella jejuensis]|uniref:SMI1 / KNR4 family (SUKH-1) n=1 Tax=Hyunsoonleella jejuensis TaxID=419940 RepID=A0A1H9LKB1_9FLAO|nr:hypothetical protein [Hyunsoonleella jejuensis]SER11942.1 hypothetical protein SAMN05421824_3052 [Hyunsoonleella jejuensis]